MGLAFTSLRSIRTCLQTEKSPPDVKLFKTDVGVHAWPGGPCAGPDLKINVESGQIRAGKQLDFLDYFSFLGFSVQRSPDTKLRLRPTPFSL